MRKRGKKELYENDYAMQFCIIAFYPYSHGDLWLGLCESQVLSFALYSVSIHSLFPLELDHHVRTNIKMVGKHKVTKKGCIRVMIEVGKQNDD